MARFKPKRFSRTDNPKVLGAMLKHTGGQVQNRATRRKAAALKKQLSKLAPTSEPQPETEPAT